VFLDETSTNTKLTKRTGWAPCGERYRTQAPFGAWQTQTFIAGLRQRGLVAPWLVDAPMNKQIFEIYVETQLVPTLAPRDVVILDNVAFHKGATVEALIRERGAWLLFLPPYSPDLNPIEMAFSKLKSLLRKHAARTFDALIAALGQICDLLSLSSSPAECHNTFRAV
jgi:transposase